MKNLSKHLMKVTSKNGVRKVLQGVEFNSLKKRMNATDSHRLLSYEYDGKSIQDKVINLETMEVIDSSYPDINRLLPINGYDFKIPYSEINKKLVSLLTKNKKQIIKITIQDKMIKCYVETQNKVTFNVTYEEFFEIEIEENDEWKETEAFYVNAEYLRDLFSFMLDYSSENDEKHFVFRYVGNVRPLLFRGQKYDYLITPIRVQ